MYRSGGRYYISAYRKHVRQSGYLHQTIPGLAQGLLPIKVDLDKRIATFLLCHSAHHVAPSLCSEGYVLRIAGLDGVMGSYHSQPGGLKWCRSDSVFVIPHCIPELSTIGLNFALKGDHNEWV